MFFLIRTAFWLSIVVLLLPAFFAFTGLRTQIGLISGAQWLFCALIILVASAGKFGGTVIAGRVTGLPWRDAAALGILMNTRGLMELIVASIGLQRGIITQLLFTNLVIMAIVTTALTPLLLNRFYLCQERLFLPTLGPHPGTPCCRCSDDD